MKAGEIVLHFEPDGSVSFVSEPAAEELAIAAGAISSKKRASKIEPVGICRRLIFRLLRACVSEDSRTAEWTRGWRCHWRVRIVNGPVLKDTFACRAAAIRAEVAWLNGRRA